MKACQSASFRLMEMTRSRDWSIFGLAAFDPTAAAGIEK
jgi:hypothetical protein